MLLIFKLTVSLIFLWFVLRKVNLADIMGHLRGADRVQLLYAAATLIAGGFAGAVSWLAVLRSNGYTLSYRRVAAIHWCGMFFNNFLPSNIGGDFFKGYLLVKGSGGGVERAAVTIVLDRLINLSVLVLIGILSFCLFFAHYLWAAAAVALSLGALLLLRTLAHTQVGVGGGRVVRFIRSILSFFKNGRGCTAAFIAAMLSQGLKIGCHLFLIRALGLDLALHSIWYVIPIFGVISALPISIGGIGLREYAALGVAGALALRPEELVALSLSSHLLCAAVNALGLVPFIWMRHQDAPQVIINCNS